MTFTQQEKVDAGKIVADLHRRPVKDQMKDDFYPPEDATPVIVCAANRLRSGPHQGTVFAGARHFDNVMRSQIYFAADQDNSVDATMAMNVDQGFIDQWGRFYTREEAMMVVIWSGQRFNPERQSGITDMLFSEGLY